MASKQKPSKLLNRGKSATNKDITNRNATQSPLLCLPPEIRNRLCRYVLGDHTLHMIPTRDALFAEAHEWRNAVCLLGEDEEFEYHHCDSIDRHTTRYRMRHIDHGCMPAEYRAGNLNQDGLSVALVKASRQLHTEAALLPYLLNTFVFNENIDFQSFARSLLPAQQRSIHKVIISSDGWWTWRWPAAFSKLCNLAEFTYHRRVLTLPDEPILREDILQRLEKLPLVKVNIRAEIPRLYYKDLIAERARNVEQRLLGGNEEA